MYTRTKKYTLVGSLKVISKRINYEITKTSYYKHFINIGLKLPVGGYVSMGNRRINFYTEKEIGKWIDTYKKMYQAGKIRRFKKGIIDQNREKLIVDKLHQ